MRANEGSFLDRVSVVHATSEDQEGRQQTYARNAFVRARACVRLTRFGNGNNAVKTGIGLFLVTFLSEVSISMADDEF